MLELIGLKAGYGGQQVLRGISMRARAGELTAVIGPNGCGKSTLLKTLCGILPPAGGQVLLEGESLLSLPQNLLARKVAYLAQNRQLPDITVERLVLHGRFPYLSYPRRYRPQDREAARQAMEQMDLLALAQQPLSRLSGGQQQRAYLAMALAQDTQVILLDEPTTYLDVSYQLQTLRQARALAQAGKHVIMVIHDLPQVLEHADHIVLLQQGEALIQGSAESLYRSGLLDRVFSARVLRSQVEGRWRYFCTGE